MADPRTPAVLEPPSSVKFTRRRRARNVAMLVLLLAVCALFYAITVVKMAKVG